MADIIMHVLLIILATAVIVLVVLYSLGDRLQKRQLGQQQFIGTTTQTISILVIDKKKTETTQVGLPKAVVDWMPRYMRRAKAPVVKAKIGPKVMILIADGWVSESLPIKTEAEAVVSGIYITQIRSVRGDAIPTPPKKKGFSAGLRKNK